jgi:hypothetical protein
LFVVVVAVVVAAAAAVAVVVVVVVVVCSSSSSSSSSTSTSIFTLHFMLAVKLWGYIWHSLLNPANSKISLFTCSFLQSSEQSSGDHFALFQPYFCMLIVS